MGTWFTIETIDSDTFAISEYKHWEEAHCCLVRGTDRALTVIHTPGHSPGHCCFYELERKYLYSGDLIYRGCLDAFYPKSRNQLVCDKTTCILPFTSLYQ